MRWHRLAWTTLSLAAIGTAGLATVEPWGGPAQHDSGEHGVKTTQPAKAEQAHEQRCHGLRIHMSDALKAIDAATKAVEAGEKRLALAELAKARKLIAAAHGLLPKPTVALKPANSRCPIMGTPIDPAKVPASLTRMYKGQKVGFCCGACPAAWDGLTDAEKDAKLREAGRGDKGGGA